ncbi:WhiB family transcriptional regulator [Nocardia sp. NPDC005978]|uniref:WhiB family transcriptional regulator n=1 Tax=Nocardia sp. NPDC005978 TaxID=3156725 RepID=UPI0033A15D64
MRDRLAGNGSDPHDWPNRACAGMDTEVFFPLTRAQADVAIRVCNSCPVLASCAEWAGRTDIADCVVASVWLPSDRALAQTRREGLARLDAVAATGRACVRQVRHYPESGQVAA